MTKETFLEKARKTHGNKYDYLDVPNEFNVNKTLIKVVCPKHGVFEQNARSHYRGQGCKECYFERRRKTTEQFIEDARKVHGDKYDYSKTVYKDARKKVCIICPTHGEFTIGAYEHTNKNQGCPICSKINTKQKLIVGTDEFIRRSKEIHGDKYDYSKTEYLNTHLKVKIICPKHGEFEQEPNAHLRGQGCPFCRESHLERDMTKFLDENKIEYIRGYTDKFLDHQTLDFYLPQNNIGIECQGSQHIRGKWFRDNRKSHSENIIKYDISKYHKCKDNNVKLLYYVSRKSEISKMLTEEKFQGIYNESNTFISFDKLLEKIKG